MFCPVVTGMFVHLPDGQELGDLSDWYGIQSIHLDIAPASLPLPLTLVTLQTDGARHSPQATAFVFPSSNEVIYSPFLSNLQLQTGPRCFRSRQRAITLDGAVHSPLPLAS